jgi:hypothetical protein
LIIYRCKFIEVNGSPGVAVDLGFDRLHEDERYSLLFPDDVTPLWRIVYSIMIGWLNKIVACDWLADL